MRLPWTSDLSAELRVVDLASLLLVGCHLRALVITVISSYCSLNSSNQIVSID